ncbi:hypothetical protein J4N45_14545 [Vibrio sp. SCSIO 43140]|uniref:hypothetical protein n=1 Tax=Vibrio sp. SCSIO 43140 TaxID=2819100 RepID=UPI002075603B|nr:hypothetical protein [Vibrio sp. SCSIO 43140]USD58793.1 hypothetical protein J4N45_09640 [Vibrio sp. SCSIO 43140]USD59127.1 hypothetical protein J4N45_11345 [Vibrio sp. SCSIO 43140]USD59720.1 hypothetical protein J4N45_14545 [Vibrio sp. SCSIO 43140]
MRRVLVFILKWVASMIGVAFFAGYCATIWKSESGQLLVLWIWVSMSLGITWKMFKNH